MHIAHNDVASKLRLQIIVQFYCNKMICLSVFDFCSYLLEPLLHNRPIFARWMWGFVNVKQLKKNIQNRVDAALIHPVYILCNLYLLKC